MSLGRTWFRGKALVFAHGVGPSQRQSSRKCLWSINVEAGNPWEVITDGRECEMVIQSHHWIAPETQGHELGANKGLFC